MEGTGLKSLTPNFLPRNPPQCKRMETNSLHFIKHDTVVLWGGGEGKGVPTGSTALRCKRTSRMKTGVASSKFPCKNTLLQRCLKSFIIRMSSTDWETVLRTRANRKDF